MRGGTLQENHCEVEDWVAASPQRLDGHRDAGQRPSLDPGELDVGSFCRLINANFFTKPPFQATI